MNEILHIRLKMYACVSITLLINTSVTCIWGSGITAKHWYVWEGRSNEQKQPHHIRSCQVSERLPLYIVTAAIHIFIFFCNILQAFLGAPLVRILYCNVIYIVLFALSLIVCTIRSIGRIVKYWKNRNTRQVSITDIMIDFFFVGTIPRHLSPSFAIQKNSTWTKTLSDK